MKKRKRLILLVCLAAPCLAFVLLWVTVWNIDRAAWVDSVDFSPDGQTLVVARFRKGFGDDYLFRLSPPGSVALYDARTLRFRHLLVSYSEPATSEGGVDAFYSEDGKQITVQDPSAGFSVYDMPNQQPATAAGDSSRKVERTYSRYAAYNPEHRLLANRSPDTNITVMEQATGHIEYVQLPISQRDIMFMDWLPGSQILWVGDSLGHSVFWDYRQKKTVHRFQLKTRITCVAVNSQRNTIGYGREDGSIGVVTVDALHQALKNGTAQRLLGG